MNELIIDVEGVPNKVENIVSKINETEILVML